MSKEQDFVADFPDALGTNGVLPHSAMNNTASTLNSFAYPYVIRWEFCIN
jgi:hypothetical protein